MDQNFKPDMLKIYPCLVLRSAKIFDWWKQGSYRPYKIEEVVDLIVKIKKFLPPWVRVMRIQRDIPAQLIVAGVKKGNLRQLVQEELKMRGFRCRCIRCREVGHRMLSNGFTPKPENLTIVTRLYDASDGKELFISAEEEENDVLIGYLRLRFPSSAAHRPEIIKKESSIVRELHVYGPLVPLGARRANGWQHQGYGSTLLKEAEQVSFENDRNVILVNSALGTKEYFQRRGYKSIGAYMTKVLN
jgi:elongator complex protein 3